VSLISSSFHDKMTEESPRKFNLIVFGATGFTGKHVIEEIVKTLAAGHSEPFTWAVAGRSISKMDTILTEVSNFLGLIQNFETEDGCKFL